MSCISAAATWQKIDSQQEFKPVCLVGDRGSGVDAHPDGFPDPGIALACELLGEYHRGRLLFFLQPGSPTHLRILIWQIAAGGQHGVQCADCLVCLELELT
jgi:hypothetical protein